MDTSRYGYGPGQLFTSPLTHAGSPLPPAPPAPTASTAPTPSVAELFQDPASDPTGMAPSNPHPNPTAGNMLRSAATGLGLMTPAGFAMGMLGLAISDARKDDPSFNGRSQIASAINEGFQSLFSTDRTSSAAAPGTGALTGPTGLAFGDNGKAGPGPDGGQKDGFGSPDPGKGEPGTAPNGGEKGDFASGGIVQLFGGGKVAVGPGGGMDDRIPTTIDGGRLANLSDGEFVIPADVVSAMGDGSTNAGATRLYDLVKAIRQQKTGTERQAQPVQFDQILKQVTGR